MTQKLFARYTEHEAQAVERFKCDPRFQRFKDASDRMVQFHLLQRMFLSRNFIAWYNMAITRLKLEDHKAILREIVQEEAGVHRYSRDALTFASTHLEDLVHDLKLLGIPEIKIFSNTPTPATLAAINRLEALLAVDTQSHDSDLIILASLRVAGELLVAAEYTPLVERYQMTPERGFRFFPQHAHHDSTDHPDKFAVAIERLLGDEVALEAAKQAIERAADARLSFFI